MVAKPIDRFTGRKEATLRDVLSPWSVYEFRVSTANELGYGLPSHASPTYSSQTDRPYTFPANVSGGGGKTGDLTVTWTVSVFICLFVY